MHVKHLVHAVRITTANEIGTAIDIALNQNGFAYFRVTEHHDIEIEVYFQLPVQGTLHLVGHHVVSPVLLVHD